MSCDVFRTRMEPHRSRIGWSDWPLRRRPGNSTSIRPYATTIARIGGSAATSKLSRGREAFEMAPIVLSPEQDAAIHQPGDLIVRAGAGSGKTEVLARRFVAHIAGDISGCEPLAPANIAAITFTDKATDDMR